MKNPDLLIDGVFQRLAIQPQKSPGGGRALLFVGARRGEGVTSVARIAAESGGAGAVYAIDLDLRRNALAKALAEKAQFGPKMDGRLGGVSFYTLLDQRGFAAPEPKPAFGYHRVGETRLYAGVFDARVMPVGGKIMVSPGGDYWRAGRAGGALMIVDAPALERSQIGLRVAQHMDGVVLVVAGDAGGAPAALSAKAQLDAAGANVIGIVYTKASGPIAAMDRMLRQAS